VNRYGSGSKLSGSIPVLPGDLGVCVCVYIYIKDDDADLVQC